MMYAGLRRSSRLCALGTAALLAPALGQAGMGNIGTTYGVLPSDMASAQALSMFSDQVSVTYYNPAYLTNDPRGELTAGILHSEQELRAASNQRDGDVISSTPTEHVLLGLKTDLGTLTQFDHPINLGVLAGVEKYGGEMLAFSSETSETGQFLDYGRQPLFLNIGGGTRLWRGIHAGASLRVTLQAKADLNAEANLAGDTQEEGLEVNAEPEFRPIASVNVNWGDTFCPEESCFIDGFETALAYRAESASSTTIDSNITVPTAGIEDEEPLILDISTIDSFQPEIASLGLQYRGENWRAGGSVEFQRWSSLSDEFADDTIKNQESVSVDRRLDFQDIWVPRIGGEYQLNQFLSVTGGMAYEESALETTESPEVNYFDNDRIVAGLGLSAQIDEPWLLAFPIQVNAAYQYHHLRDREFGVIPFGEDEPDEFVETDGDIHAFSASVTFRF